TSGTSPNLLTAAHAGHQTGLRCWAFTGPAPNPLADAVDEVLAVSSADSQVVQELHLVSAHVLCEYVDRALTATPGAAAHPVPAGDSRSGPVRTGVEVVLGAEPEVEPR
ncbi:phosphoheptose isomerase, partial [Micromonospora sp. NPDC050686]